MQPGLGNGVQAAGAVVAWRVPSLQGVAGGLGWKDVVSSHLKVSPLEIRGQCCAGWQRTSPQWVAGQVTGTVGEMTA